MSIMTSGHRKDGNSRLETGQQETDHGASIMIGNQNHHGQERRDNIMMQ